MVGTPRGISTGVLMEMLTGIRCDIAELKAVQESMTASYQQFREAYSTEHVKVVIKAEAAHDRINSLEKRVNDLDMAVRPLIVWGKVFAFIASVLGASIIALIWSIVTNQVTIVIP